MRMNAQLHAILTYAGIDPAAFVLEMAERDPSGMGPNHNWAKELAAARPDIGIIWMNAAMWAGTVDLYSLVGQDAGGKIEIMRIGDSEHITFTPPLDAETTFDLVKGGSRDLNRPRALDSLRKPVADKPAWLADANGRVHVSRHLDRDRVGVICNTAYVEVDVVVPDPYADEMPIAA